MPRTKKPSPPDPQTDPPDRVLDLAVGHRLPAPIEHSAAVDAAFHLGLQDAPHYDREAINPDQPLRFDHECAEGLARLLEARTNEVDHQLEPQFDIVKDRRADERRALVRVDQADTRHSAAQKAAGDRLEALRSDHPDIDATSLPRPSGKRGRPAQDLSFWVLMTCFGTAEGVINYLAMLYLRDSTLITVALAASVSAGLLGAFYYIAKLKSLRPSVGLLTAISALLLVTVGTGAMRFAYAKDRILAGLAKQAESNAAPATLSVFMVIALLAFSFGLPLLFGAITYLKVRASAFSAVAGARSLREDALAAEDVLAEARELVVATRNGRLNAEEGVTTLIAQAESMVRTDAAARIEIHSAYYRGLAHGLSDPAVTARLDRRFDHAQTSAAAVVEKSLEEAVGRLRELAALARTRVDRGAEPDRP